MNWPMVMLLYSGKSVTNIQNTYLHFNRLSSPGQYFIIVHVILHLQILHGNIHQTLVNSLHGLLNFEIGGLECGLDCLVITTK